MIKDDAVRELYSDLYDETQSFENDLDVKKFVIDPNAKKFFLDIDQDQSLAFLNDAYVQLVRDYDEMLLYCKLLNAKDAQIAYLRDKKSLLVTSKSRGGFQVRELSKTTSHKVYTLDEEKGSKIPFGKGKG